MSTNYSHFSNSDMSYQDFENEKKGEPSPNTNNHQQFKNLFDDGYMSTIGIHAPATDWNNSKWEITNKRNPYSDGTPVYVKDEKSVINVFQSILKKFETTF